MEGGCYTAEEAAKFNNGENFEREGRGMLDKILGELEEIGYEVQPFIIPAVAINAPHRRDRVWVIAKHTKGKFGDSCGHKVRKDEENPRLGKPNQYEDRQNADSNTPSERSNIRECDGQERHFQDDKGLTEKDKSEWKGRQCGVGEIDTTVWEQNWIEVATSLCGMDDGLSAELDGFKLSQAQHRVQRLKALGNSIVPQVAIEIMRAIKYVEVKP